MATTTKAKDAQELFNVQVPEALKNYPDKAKEVDATFFFDITGEGGGKWTVDLKSDEPSVKTGGTPDSAECGIVVAHEDFKEILKDPNVGMQLYFQGKLQVTGNPVVATKLQELLSLGAEGDS
ncbi:MAG: SCP2 sterol-binding domain-containing protein [Proteobacteria bacterium]|nr:SCP2 sterol-binding domain-containing protein [Pseudomonadota bacterium]